MRRFIFCTLLFVNTSIWPCGAAQRAVLAPPAPAVVNGPPLQVGRSTIEVHVQRLGDETPIPGAAITVSEVTSYVRNVSTVNPQATGTTNSDGIFKLQDMAPGLYLLQAKREGYVSADRTTASAIYVRAGAGPDASKATLRLAALATLGGRVVDAEGKPLAGVGVVALVKYFPGGWPGLILTGPQSYSTNNAGEYRIPNLAPGEYYVRANGRPLQGSDPPRILTDVYYPSAPDSSTAVPIVLKPGEENTGVNFQMGVAPAYKIFGKAINLSAPLRNEGIAAGSPGSFHLIPAGPALVQTGRRIEVRVETRPEGAFVIHGVPPGSWYLYNRVQTQVAPVGQPARYLTTVDRVAVNVIDRDVEGVVITIGGDKISGTIVRAGTTTPPEGSRPRITLFPRDTLPNGFLVNNSADANALGAFDLPDTPANHYRVSVSGFPPDFYVSDMRLGGNSIIARPFIDVGPGTIEPLQVIVSSGAATLEGSVQGVNAESLTVESVQLVLVVLVPLREGATVVRSARLQPDGTFRLTGVAPGSYRIFAAANVRDANIEYDPGFRERFASKAQTITVAGGQSLAVQLDLIR